MISHAAATAAFPVGPLAVAVIQPGFQALSVSPIGKPPLFPPRFLPARFPAVAMSPVAGIADVERRPAIRPVASQLPQHHCFGHRSTPHGRGQLLCRGTLAVLWAGPLNGTAIKKPRSLQRSGFPFPTSVLPCRSLGKPQVPVRAYAKSIFFTSTRSPLWAANRKWLPEPAGLRVMDGSQVDCGLLPRSGAAKGGDMEGMESRVDWGRDRRSVVHPPPTELEQLRPCAGRFMLLRGACAIHGIPRRGRSLASIPETASPEPAPPAGS